MSIVERISRRLRGRPAGTALAAETRATRDVLAASITGLARAMEERFVSLAERVDGLRDSQAEGAERAADALSGRLGDRLDAMRATLDARLDKVASEVEALRNGQDFSRALRELKRDLGAQISLSTFDMAAEIRAVSSLGSAADLRPGSAVPVRLSPP